MNFSYFTQNSFTYTYLKSSSLITCSICGIPDILLNLIFIIRELSSILCNIRRLILYSCPGLSFMLLTIFFFYSFLIISLYFQCFNMASDFVVTFSVIVHNSSHIVKFLYLRDFDVFISVSASTTVPISNAHAFCFISERKDSRCLHKILIFYSRIFPFILICCVTIQPFERITSSTFNLINPTYYITDVI